MFFPAKPRCRFSLKARAVNFRLRTLSPSSFPFKFSSARGVRGITVSSFNRSPWLTLLNQPAASSHRTFCSSAIMASRIDGTAIAKSIRAGLKAEIEQTQLTNPRFKPNLIIFQGKWDVIVVIERNMCVIGLTNFAYLYSWKPLRF